MENNNNIDQERFEIIERYINNTMKAKERDQFEIELEVNLALKQQVADIKAILSGVETSVLKNKLDEFHEDIIPSTDVETTNSPRKLNLVKLAVAASLMIAAGSLWFFNQSSQSEKLYAKYFKPDPGLPTNMSSNSNFEFYDAMVNYKQGDYSTAIKKWESLLDEKPLNDTLNYFIGVAHLANDDGESAITYLDAAKNSSNSTFKNDIHYYLGLAYLKTENIDNAKSNFEQSTIDGSKEILDELNN